MKYYFGKLFVVFFLFFISSVSAQKLSDAHITGHVIDAETQRHLPYSTILVKGLSAGAVCDESGHFLIKHLPVGEYILVASSVGYQTMELPVEVLPQQTVEVKFSLQPQVLMMDAVVVSASRNESNKREASSIVNVVSGKLFDKTASNNVADVLNYLPGLRVESTCSNCGVPQLRINGMGGEYSQILLDSRPLFSALASVYGLEQLPAGMIERVEVIRGGGSALFGSSAIGGVVNIITKEPLTNSLSLGSRASIWEGGALDIQTTLNASLVSENFKSGAYIFGMIKDRDAYDRDGDGFSESPELGSETVGFRTYYKVSPTSRYTLEYHHIREDRRGGNDLDRPPHEADIAEQLSHRIHGGGLKYDYLSRNLLHRANAYLSLQHIHRDSYFGTGQDLSAYGKTFDMTWVVGGQYTLEMKRFLFMPAALTVGVEYNDNRLNDQMLGYDRILEQSSISYGTFLQNEWKDEQWSILLGARLDKHNKVKQAIFSPRMNVRYTPIPQIGLRASYSSGYRAPQAYEEDLHVEAVGGKVALIVLDPQLRPEYAHSWSSSVDAYLRMGEKVDANLLVEGFYTRLRDVFTLERLGEDADSNHIWERRNRSGATILGLNLEYKMSVGRRWLVDAGYTFQRSRYTEPTTWSEDPSLAPQRQMFRTPNQYGYLNVSYMPIDGLSIGVGGKYTGQMLVQHSLPTHDEEVTTPSFVDVDIRLSYDIALSGRSLLKLSCGVKNIFDTFQKDLDQGILRDAGYIYGPSAPRNIYVGVTFSL